MSKYIAKNRTPAIVCTKCLKEYAVSCRALVTIFSARHHTALDSKTIWNILLDPETPFLPVVTRPRPTSTRDQLVRAKTPGRTKFRIEKKTDNVNSLVFIVILTTLYLHCSPFISHYLCSFHPSKQLNILHLPLAEMVGMSIPQGS